MSRSWRSRSMRRRIPACTVTSRAVVGSSAISSLRSAGEGDGDGDALAHPAGELVREARQDVLGVGQAHRLEQLDRPLPGLGRGEPEVDLDVLGELAPDAEHRVQRRHRVLEDDGDLVAAHAPQPRLAHRQHVLRPAKRTAPVARDRSGKKPSADSPVSVLPLPDSPARPTTEPGATASDTPSTRAISRRLAQQDAQVLDLQHVHWSMATDSERVSVSGRAASHRLRRRGSH